MTLAGFPEITTQVDLPESTTQVDLPEITTQADLPEITIEAGPREIMNRPIAVGLLEIMSPVKGAEYLTTPSPTCAEWHQRVLHLVICLSPSLWTPQTFPTTKTKCLIYQ